MSPLARWSIRGGAAIAISTISVLGTLVWVEFHPDAKPDAPLTIGLHGKWADISAEFDRRVKTEFAIGSSEMEMATKLKAQRFSRVDWDASVQNEHEAVRREDNIVCRQAARVFWRVDSGGTLTAIRGEYREEGCL
jgi:hypothetical protein